MIIIRVERRTGKTTKLIKISAETGYYIVTKNTVTAKLIFKQSQQMKLKIPFPLTFREFTEDQYYPLGVKGLLVDNMELLLNDISQGLIKYCTTTAEVRGADEA